jgi:outer membrane protein OmpA-like peptidoglycan-associated protein/tetratricopeptide (TPR) repeat protein
MNRHEYFIFIASYYMKKILFIILFASSLSAKAQWYDADKMPAKAQMVYSGAIQALQDGEWQNAKILLNRAISMDGRYIDAWLSLAGLYGQLKKYDSAVYYYQKGMALDSVYSANMLLPLSINLAGQGKFADAKAAVDKLIIYPEMDARTIKAAQYRQKTYQFALDFAAKHGEQPVVNRHNLGDSINSSSSEYYPSFTIDDSVMVFTRLGAPGNRREDFIKTEKINGVYRKATPVDGSLNEEPMKGGLSITQDGEWLIFAADFGGKGNGNFDIYISYNTPQGWSEPFNLGDNINTEFWESSPSLSPDKQTLYFSSNRSGGYGGKDLYVSHRLPNGNWGKAENMGPNFNTSADDLAPFIHADNQTLYFTSGGHDGYGGSDIYVSRKGPGGAWSVPENIGYPINTIEDEGSMIVTADGKTAYFAGNGADTRGLLDLYSFEMPVYARPKRTLWVKGQVRDAISNKGLPSSVELKEIATGQVLEKVTTDETGNYLVTLPIGHDYTFTVNRKGYLFYSDNFLLASRPSDSTYQKDIPLQPIAINASLALKNIFFETNSFKLNSSSFTELDKLLQLMQDNATVKIQIGGHTDNTGLAAENLKLSSNRAKAVVDYLVSKGIAATRLTFKGFGASKPIADNKTEEGKAKNRRTEIVITGI